MERYYEEDDDDSDKENEPFFGDGEDDGDLEIAGFIDQQALIDVMKMDVMQVKLNQRLLDKAIKIAKDSWFWSFHSSTYKMQQIESIFQSLVKMTIGEPEELTEEDLEELEEI